MLFNLSIIFCAASLLASFFINLSACHFRGLNWGSILAHALQFINHLLCCLPLASSCSTFPHGSNTTHDGEVSEMRLSSNSTKIISRHGVSMLDTELLKGTNSVSRSLRTSSILGDRRQWSM